MKKATLALLALLTWAQADLSRDPSTGIVKDSLTLLEWQDDYSDREDNTTPYLSWTSAISYCHDLDLDGKNWRLPNINELKSIISETQFSPTIDVAFQTTRTNHYYWSATTVQYGSSYAWHVHFSNGGVSHYNKGTNNYVRCVRAGQ